MNKPNNSLNMEHSTDFYQQPTEQHQINRLNLQQEEQVRRSVHAVANASSTATQQRSQAVVQHNNNNLFQDSRLNSFSKQTLKRCSNLDDDSYTGFTIINSPPYTLSNLQSAASSTGCCNQTNTLLGGLQQPHNNIMMPFLKSNLKVARQAPLAAPKPVRACRPPSPNQQLLHPPRLVDSTKKSQWSQASPIKNEIDQKKDLHLEGRRNNSMQSQSEFQLSDEGPGYCSGSVVARRINFQNEQNLSFIIQKDEIKNRSKSPLKDLKDLLDAEQEFKSIFSNKTRATVSKDLIRKPAFQKGTKNISPEARTAADDQCFSERSSCSNFKQTTFSHYQVSQASIERSTLYPYSMHRGLTVLGSVYTERDMQESFIIKRLSCNPFKKMDSSPEQNKEQGCEVQHCNLQSMAQTPLAQEQPITIVDEQQNESEKQAYQSGFCENENYNYLISQSEHLEAAFPNPGLFYGAYQQVPSYHFQPYSLKEGLQVPDYADMQNPQSQSWQEVSDPQISNLRYAPPLYSPYMMPTQNLGCSYPYYTSDYGTSLEQQTLSMQSCSFEMTEFQDHQMIHNVLQIQDAMLPQLMALYPEQYYNYEEANPNDNNDDNGNAITVQE